MSLKTLEFKESYPISPEELFAVLVDHEGMSDWFDVDIRTIAGPGDGGVGTVRRISIGPLKIDEEIIVADSPSRVVYRIIRGLPVGYHLGEQRIIATDDGSELRWTITMRSAVPGLIEVISLILRPAMNRGLKKLRSRYP